MDDMKIASLHTATKSAYDRGQDLALLAASLQFEVLNGSYKGQVVEGVEVSAEAQAQIFMSQGRELLREGDRQTWLPFDTPGAVRRFFQHWQPRLGVLMETEVWPTLQREAERRGLPLVIANARLSEKSLRQGQRFEIGRAHV